MTPPAPLGPQMKLKLYVCALALLSAASLYGQADPVAFISQPLVPTSVAPGSGAFTLTINGTGFTTNSIVHWNGNPRTLNFNFVSSSQLMVDIPAADVATATTAEVAVDNPAPGGSGSIRSNIVFFHVTNPTASVSMSKTDYAAGTPYSVATQDFNGDGMLDLVVANYFHNTVSILLGNGDGTFQTQSTFATGNYPYTVTTGDFNGDGKLDLAVANYGDNTVSILLGNGDGTFQTQSTFATGAGPFSPKPGDFNGDGKLDLAVGYNSGNRVSILLGIGDGTFQAYVDFAAGIIPAQVTTADFNADGKLDLAVASYGGSTVSILLGNGDGTFQTQTSFATGAAPVSAETGDFNGDGRLDLAVPNAGSATVSILLGIGDGTFQANFDFATGLQPFSVTMGDFNADGKLDLAVANLAGNTVSVLLQPAPTVQLSTTSLNFGDQLVNTTSGVMQVTLTNTGTATLNISNMALSGTDAARFAIEAGQTTCTGATALVVDGTCIFALTFSPTAEASYSASLDITSDAPGSPHHVDLTGTGVPPAPLVNFAPGTLDFGNQLVGTASTTKSIVLSNPGTDVLNITSISASGDFSQVNNCPITPATLDIDTNCTVDVTFDPSARGTLNGAVTIVDDASGSPHSVSLTGKGVIPAAVGLSTAGLDFGDRLIGTTSAAQNVTLTNTGDLTLNITSIAASGDFAIAGASTCPAAGTVAGGASCVTGVTFTPTTTGARSGNLTVTSDGTESPHVVNLSGTGTDFALDVQSGGATSATVSAGSTATFNLQIEPTGFVGNVSLGCAFQGTTPRGASCSVTPNSVELNGTDPSPFKVNVSTTARSLAVPRGPELPPMHAPWVRHAVPLLLGLMMLMLAIKSRRVKESAAADATRAWPPLYATLLIVMLWAACGGGGGGGGTPTPPQVGTPAGNYTLTLTATTGGVSKTQNLTLRVN